MRILVLRGGALGDFLVTLPALGLLRTRWPEAHVTLVGNATAAALALRPAGRYLDAVVSQHEARWSALYGRDPLPPALAAWLEPFDLVISYWPDPEGELHARFPLRAGQRLLTAAAQPTLAPAAAHYCQPLAALGLSTADFRSRLYLPSDDGLSLDPFPLRLAVHPGSGSGRKNWPLARWAELLAALDEPVLIVGGPADDARLDALARVPWRYPPRWARHWPLPRLAATLARCRRFLGHDSGVAHLAAAVGVPCLLLFGPTDPAVWAPPSPTVTVLTGGADWEGLTVDSVVSALG